MRQSRKIRSNVTPTFAFVVDGETEIWYLQMLKRNERQLRLNIKPEIPNKKSIEEQFKLVEDLSESEYPKVFWLVDLDTIIKESRETPKGKKTPLRAFLEIRKVIKRDYKNVIIVINNPCLETAISNSESLGQFDMDEQTKAICEMYLLFQTDELKKIL